MLRYMTGSRPEKSMTVAAYSSPLSVTTAVELCRGSYGQRATPFTRSSTRLMLPTWGGGGGEVRRTREWTERVQSRASFLTSLLMHSGWKALVPQVMISVLFTSRTLM